MKKVKTYDFEVKSHPRNPDFQLYIGLDKSTGNFALRRGEISEGTRFVKGYLQTTDNPEYPFELKVHSEYTAQEWFKASDMKVEVDFERTKATMQALFADIQEFEFEDDPVQEVKKKSKKSKKGA